MLRLGVLTVLLHLVMGYAQNPSSSQQRPPGFRVEVDAIVVDSDGNFVGDLDSDDFEILRKTSNQKIPGALHENPAQDATAWLHKYSKDKTIVLY